MHNYNRQPSTGYTVIQYTVNPWHSGGPRRAGVVAYLNVLTYLCFCDNAQSTPLKWTVLGPDYEYPLRRSIHLSMFYTLHSVQTGPDK